MKKPQNIRIKLIALAVGLTIIPMSYAGINNFLKNEPRPKIEEDLKNIPYEKWQDTDSGRFAHALQYDDKLAKPVPYSFIKGKDYRQESIDYFEHLCKTEGKDYIYSTAKNVDTVAQLRSFEIPMQKMQHWDPQYYKLHPYAMEAPLFFNENIAGLIDLEMRNSQDSLS